MMALQNAFEGVQARLKELQEALLHLQWAVEARSERIDHHLADRLEDQLIPDLQGLIKDAVFEAEIGAAASGQPPDIGTSGRALLACQKDVNQIVAKFWTELGSYRPIADLIGLGEERSAEWREWTYGVLNALDRFQQPVYHVSEAVLQCWQELLERIGTTSISVKATNIGQQIGLSEEERAVAKSAT
jgi:hypothetical protein